MNDKELADKVVALGVGCKSVAHYAFSPSGAYIAPQYFVRRWDVTGELLEKWGRFIKIDNDVPEWVVACCLPEGHTHVGLILPRTIIEALVEAFAIKQKRVQTGLTPNE